MKYEGYFVHNIECMNDFTAHVRSEEKLRGVKFYLDGKLKHYAPATRAKEFEWKEFNMGELEEDTTCEVVAIS